MSGMTPQQIAQHTLSARMTSIRQLASTLGVTNITDMQMRQLLFESQRGAPGGSGGGQSGGNEGLI
ncbi:UNVERIFIED_CONTAM: hypothetical protein NY603_39535, partial [Bacteroidetes bacterium 56_B9]